MSEFSSTDMNKVDKSEPSGSLRTSASIFVTALTFALIACAVSIYLGSKWVQFTTLGIAFLVVLVCFWSFATKVNGRLSEFADFANNLAEGKIDREIFSTDSDDELGNLASALKSLSKSVLDKQQHEDASNNALEIARSGNDEKDQALLVFKEQTKQAVDSISISLEKMLGGELAAQMHEPLQDELDKLRRNLNQVSQKFSNTFSEIVSISDSISSSVGELVTASDDLSNRTEIQASALEDTAASVRRIKETVENSFKGAEETKRIVNTAKNDASSSGEVVGRALSAMNEIEESAAEINQIISVIDEIAFQTNLLALNAGVEAARAGEAGQGFAVVASEVRALAQRSATAAKEIKDLISKSSDQVASGSKLVGETGETLKKISEQVIELSSVVETIASDTTEQHQSLNELNTSVAEIDSSTQQNAAIAEQSTAACHSLKNEADSLSRIVSDFKTTVHKTNLQKSKPIAQSERPAKPQSQTAVKTTHKKPAVGPKLANEGELPSKSPAKELMSKVEGAFSAPAPKAKTEKKPEKSFLGNTAIKEDDWEEF